MEKKCCKCEGVLLAIICVLVFNKTFVSYLNISSVNNLKIHLYLCAYTLVAFVHIDSLIGTSSLIAVMWRGFIQQRYQCCFSIALLMESDPHKVTSKSINFNILLYV